MNFVFFAARQLHRQYFSRVSQQLNTLEPQGRSKVLWHKTLWQTIYWIPQLAFNNSKTSQQRQQIVNDHLREKQNSRKGRLRSALYWRCFRGLKTVEARLLFAIYRQALIQTNTHQMVIWNGLKYRQRLAVCAAESCEMKVVYMENGLLPDMTTIDPKGINYLNSVPRDINAFQALAPIDLSPLNKSLKQQFAPRPQHLPESYIFVPFQVNTDSQVVLFSPWIKDMYALVQEFEQAAEKLGKQMPDIIFKTHPACDQNYADLIKHLENHNKLHIDNDTPTPVLIQHAIAVATINSTVGIEALLLDKKLLVLGHAFYSYPSLSLRADSQQALQHCLQQLPDWQPNHLHIQQFFNYLSNRYQLPGKWQHADESHLQACAQRLLELSK